MRVWKFEGSPQSAYFAVGVLTLLGGFLTDLVDFGHFWAPFFPFFALFRFPNTVYSHGGRVADD
jgi:hypothetical protein